MPNPSLRSLDHSLEHRMRRAFHSGPACINVSLALGWLLVMLVVGGCGLKTQPRPSEEIIPTTEGMESHARPEGIVISWLPPEGALKRRFGKVVAYVLTIEYLPLYCAPCPPERREEVVLPADSKSLVLEKERLFYFHPLSGGAALLRIGMVTEFKAGSNTPSNRQELERRGEIPRPLLKWQWEGDPEHSEGLPGKAGSGNTGSSASPSDSSAIRFFWSPEREGFRRVQNGKGAVTEAVRYFRGNLYRRLPPAPWPFTPINPRPLEKTLWTVPKAALEEGAEYRLRLVDRNGGEGPPSPGVVPLQGKGRP